MRRKDREQNSPEFLHAVLTNASDMALAFCTEDFPYVIPVNFVWFKDALWFHCANEGRKLDCILNNPHVGFTMQCNTEIVPERSTTLYDSVCGEGLAELVEDADTKQAALAELARKYHAACALPAPESMLNRTAIVRIRIQSLSGKQHARKPE